MQVHHINNVFQTHIFVICKSHLIQDSQHGSLKHVELECWPMQNVTATLTNIGGVLYKSSLIPFLVYHATKFGSRPLLERCAVMQTI